MPSPHSHVLQGPSVSVWGMVIASQSLSQAGKRLLCTCASEMKRLCKKLLGGGKEKSKRNECVIPGSWDFPKQVTVLL